MKDYNSDFKRNKREMEKYVKAAPRFSTYEHYYWCEHTCKIDHRYEMEFCEQQRLKAFKTSAAKAVRIAINRFLKKYPNSKIKFNSNHLQDLLIKRNKRCEVFYELELELIPLNDRIYQIKYLVD